MARSWLSAQHGFRISKPGVEVKTANASQLSFTSDLRTPYIYYQARTSVPAGGTRTLSFPTADRPPLPWGAPVNTSTRKLVFGFGFWQMSFDGSYYDLIFGFRIQVTRNSVTIANESGNSVTVDVVLIGVGS